MVHLQLLPKSEPKLISHEDEGKPWYILGRWKYSIP